MRVVALTDFVHGTLRAFRGQPIDPGLSETIVTELHRAGLVEIHEQGDQAAARALDDARVAPGVTPSVTPARAPLTIPVMVKAKTK